jgi:hypothetical protein
LYFQRIWREKQRKKEETERIKNRNNCTVEHARKMMDDANTPYYPKCDPALASRVMAASEALPPFLTIRHLTAETALTQISNGYLGGRRTLKNQGIPFRPAVLEQSDINNGDGNAICFGLGRGMIDPKCLKSNTVQIEFDFQKMQRNNPHVFYKQRDFGYFAYEYNPNKLSKHEYAHGRDVHKKRNIQIGGNTLLQFTHREKDSKYVFKVIITDGTSVIKGYTDRVSNDLLIAYDLTKMPQILTLNFFRFLDALPNDLRQYIYGKIEKLGHEDLLKFLTELCIQMTDTTEFNFYGAHKIDFSTILSITSKAEVPAVAYTLELPQFIRRLHNGDGSFLDEANDKIPALFQSYRFIDYLLEILKLNPETKAIRKKLLMFRASCPSPRQSWQQQLRNQERRCYRQTQVSIEEHKSKKSKLEAQALSPVAIHFQFLATERKCTAEPTVPSGLLSSTYKDEVSMLVKPMCNCL